MRVGTRDYGSLFPFLLATLVLLMGTLTGWAWHRKTRGERLAIAKADLRSLGVSLQVYQVDNESYPTTGQGLDAFLYPPKLPPLPKNWRGTYWVGPAIPLDPWGHPYVYRCPGVLNPAGYDLFSLGPDGTPGTEDDIEH